jgi:hypothetical protein
MDGDGKDLFQRLKTPSALFPGQCRTDGLVERKLGLLNGHKAGVAENEFFMNSSEVCHEI